MADWIADHGWIPFVGEVVYLVIHHFTKNGSSPPKDSGATICTANCPTPPPPCNGVGDSAGRDHTTLAKIESGRRNISFVEARALASILDTNVAGLDLAIEALENANYVATSAPRRKR